MRSPSPHAGFAWGEGAGGMRGRFFPSVGPGCSALRPGEVWQVAEGERLLILDYTGCVATRTETDMGKKAKPATIQGHGREMRVIYPDARIEPCQCVRTNMRREFCPCAPCRVLRRRKHRASCSCWLCYADRMGKFIDDLARRTVAGHWLCFVTLTFRTPYFPWAKGFPIEQPKPRPDFVHHFFSRVISWIACQVHGRVEYCVVDQFGETGWRPPLPCVRL